MKRSPDRLLTLRTQTVRQLTDDRLREVVGGATGRTICPTYYSEREGTCSTSDHCYRDETPA